MIEDNYQLIVPYSLGFIKDLSNEKKNLPLSGCWQIVNTEFKN
jgi:hypothetical protein